MGTEKYIHLSSAEVENFQSRYSITGDAPDIAMLSEKVSTCPFGRSSSVVPLFTEPVFVLNQKGVSLQTWLCLPTQSEMEPQEDSSTGKGRIRPDTWNLWPNPTLSGKLIEI